jgi:Pyrimidine dimer DNA glycosylase
MNIFFLSISIKRCAKYHFDKHVVKMILEYCQLLSTAWHILNNAQAQLYLKNGKIYRKTHVNHPCAIWTRQHINNYIFVAKLGLELCNEWRRRYDHTRLHACETKLLFLLENVPLSIPVYSIKKTKNNPKSFSLPMPQAMPTECKINKNSVHSCVLAYRNYYMSNYKKHLVMWNKKLEYPMWWTNKKN